jgi:hypothetical protein
MFGTNEVGINLYDGGYIKLIVSTRSLPLQYVWQQRRRNI